MLQLEAATRGSRLEPEAPGTRNERSPTQGTKPRYARAIGAFSLELELGGLDETRALGEMTVHDLGELEHRNLRLAK